MSGFKNFAVCGTGNIGSFIADHLLDLKEAGKIENLTILTRVSSHARAAEKYASTGAAVIGVDYSDRTELKLALSGTDVVISTVTGFVLQVQATIAEAAKDAGVHLFVPSEFGPPPQEGEASVLAVKAHLHAKFAEIGLPCLFVYTGIFSDLAWFPGAGGLDIASGKLAIGGDGNQNMSWTARADVARFLGYALTQLPVQRLRNQELRLEGDLKSFNQIFSEYEGKTGKKLEVTHLSIDELNARIQANPKDIAAMLLKSFALGGGLVGTPDNDLYPQWNPTPVLTFTSVL
ncbi:NAD-P-binding protein [Auriscalpium vulgare]|uniref:NAD-P-binding protein n=1 Tax=Auriscalpium vulgare TaxID=40419 RepID=A0ACB8RZ19_9AGAM|nr:NAD-P-binding protein [Auriscalpium vulgare]